MSDLVAFLRARLAEDERVALAASGRYDHPVTEPEHWHWECTEDDEPIDVDLAIAGNEEMLDHGSEHFRVGLRSVEQYPTRSVGLLSHLVIDGEEVRPQDARHIARHDPARVLREVEADRMVLAGHAAAHAAHREARSLGADDPLRLSAAYQVLLWERVLKIRAAVYADHPDYQQEWKP